MSKRKQLSGRERRERRRQARGAATWLRRFPLVALIGATPLAVAIVLLFEIGGGDGNSDAGREPTVVTRPTVLVSTPEPLLSPGPTRPPAVDGEPIITDSGLGIIDIEEGTGEGPAEGEVVVVHYTGWLSDDGSKFDSSLDRGMPFEFVIGAARVIAGWDEGIASMKVGGKRRLIIPPGLGYGESSGPGGTIPPNSTLIFDVELLQVRRERLETQ